MLKKIKTSLLEMAYEETSNPNGAPVILMHGFPDDALTWNPIADSLAAEGFRTLAIYTRGYGATRFLDDATMRSGEGVAYAEDVIEFADALGIEKFTFVGHDWGAIAAYLLGILHPERLRGLVPIGVSYESSLPNYVDALISMLQVSAYWYRWLFNTDKGPETLAARTEELCRFMWRMWSPDWDFTEAEFQATAESWDNPDFQQIIIHSYRFAYRNAAGDARYQKFEPKMLGKPKISVPTIVLHGANDRVSLPESSENQEQYFTDFYERRLLENVGHFLPRERPEAVVEAVLRLAQTESRTKIEAV